MQIHQLLFAWETVRSLLQQNTLPPLVILQFISLSKCVYNAFADNACIIINNLSLLMFVLYIADKSVGLK